MKMLLALTDASIAEDTVRYARTLAAAMDAEIVCMHVIPDRAVDTDPEAGIVPAVLSDEILETGN